MSYIGKQPTKAPLTASDIEDGIITAAKIEDGAVVAAEIASNAVTTAKINADAVTGAKIADDAINSEHYTDGSVDTAHIADANVTSAKIAGDAITAAKIADNAISEEHLDVTSITGHTAETSIADGDTILIHDASASALRKMTKANFVSGVGENNRPYLKAAMHPSGTTTLSNETTTKVAFNQQLVSVDGTYSESDARWTPGVAGRYFIQAQIFIDWGNASGHRMDTAIRVNNSAVVEARLRTSGDLGGSSPVYIAGIVTLDDNDYVEIFCFGGMGANKDFDKNQAYTWFNGFKIANT